VGNLEQILITGTREIAKVLGLRVNQTRRLVKTEGFPAIKCGNKWLTMHENLKKWADEFLIPGKVSHSQ
jgi:excisionase family DNA binding protein